MSQNSRQTAERKGRSAELLAAMLLRLKGYRVLARRFKCKAGEIDIIAQKKDLIVFVEVKARQSVTDAFESITAKQRTRIETAASVWLQQQASQEFACRFDVIAVAPGRVPAHMMDAWRPGW